MIAVVTVLCAFPLGYFLRSHLAANTAYAIAYLWAFVFQTLYLMLDALRGLQQSGVRDRATSPGTYGAVALGDLPRRASACVGPRPLASKAKRRRTTGPAEPNSRAV